MLCVMGALVYLYLSAGISFLSTWGEAKHNSAQVRTLEREHRALTAQHRELGTHATVWREARALGLARPGEVTYIVKGLPNN